LLILEIQLIFSDEMIRSMTRSIAASAGTYAQRIGLVGNDKFRPAPAVTRFDWKYPTTLTALGIHTSTENSAARKGTRERKAKGKVKKEEKIRPFLRRLEEQKR